MNQVSADNFINFNETHKRRSNTDDDSSSDIGHNIIFHVHSIFMKHYRQTYDFISFFSSHTSKWFALLYAEPEKKEGGRSAVQKKEKSKISQLFALPFPFLRFIIAGPRAMFIKAASDLFT